MHTRTSPLKNASLLQHDEHHGARPPAFAPVASADMSGGLPPPPAYNSLAVTAPAQGASQAGEASAPVFAGVVCVCILVRALARVCACVRARMPV